MTGSLLSVCSCSHSGPITPAHVRDLQSPTSLVVHDLTILFQSVKNSACISIFEKDGYHIPFPKGNMGFKISVDN